MNRFNNITDKQDFVKGFIWCSHLLHILFCVLT